MSIVLYHGSNVPIKEIDLNKSLADKDFGKGFYLTDIKEQAEAMAVRRTRIMRTGEPTVSAFEFDDSVLHSTSLNVKIFDDIPSEEWALFILANRNATKTYFCHDFDIVVGPVANDGVAYQLEQYEEGHIDLLTLVRELSYRKLNRQFFFGTQRAIETLRRI